MDGARVPVMTVMIGLPATGKTTIARQIESERGAVRLSPDEWMVPLFGEPEADGARDVLEGRLISLALRLLQRGVDVVLDFGVWSRDERSALRSLAAEVGARCKLVYLTADVEEQLRRIEHRTSTDPRTSFAITANELLDFRAWFEEPDDAELSGAVQDEPPLGNATWRAWAETRWPTSTA